LIQKSFVISAPTSARVNYGRGPNASEKMDSHLHRKDIDTFRLIINTCINPACHLVNSINTKYFLAIVVKLVYNYLIDNY